MSGGVAYGSYQAGVLRAFQDMNVRYDVALGTSSGALNCALWAVGADAAAIWAQLPDQNLVHAKREYARLFTPSSGVINRAVELARAFRGMTRDGGDVQGLFESSTIVDFLASHLTDPQGSALDFKIPVFWTTNDLRTTRRFIRYRMSRTMDARVCVALDYAAHDPDFDYVLDDLTNQKDPRKLAEAVRSSTAIPLVFDPSKDGTHVFVDGGVVSNTPIGLAQMFAKSGPLVIDIVQINPIVRENTADSLRNAKGLAEASLRLIEQRLMDDALAQLRLRQRYEALADLQRKNDLTVRVLYPSQVVKSNLVNSFNDRRFILDNIALGEADAKAGCWHDYDQYRSRRRTERSTAI